MYKHMNVQVDTHSTNNLSSLSAGFGCRQVCGDWKEGINQRQRISNIIETSLDISFTSQQHSVTPHESNHVTKHNKAALIDTNSPNDKCPGILHKIKHKWWTLRCPSYHTVLYFLCRGCEDSKCVQHVRNHFLCCLVVHLGNLSLQWLSSTSFTGAHWVQVNSSMN